MSDEVKLDTDNFLLKEEYPPLSPIKSSERFNKYLKLF
jgi:hypothetical protein